MDIIKIALTGGPAGGKTSVLNAIKELSVNDVDSKYKNIIHLNGKKIKLITVPETATELISNGITPVEANNVYDFQNILFGVQKAKEELVEQAVRFGYDADMCLFIYDRGLLDGRAYLNSKEEFERLVTENDMEELEILDQYDLVIDLLSTATCLPQKYSLENNKARFEEAEWAKSIDYLTSTAWVGHRNLKLFRSDIPLQKEIDQVINHIKDYITYGIKDNQEKYLIETDPDDFYQYTNENSRTIQVNNKYMNFGLPSYLDTILIKRTYRDYSTYFLQVVSNRSNKSVVIGDQKIDELAYSELLNKNEVIDETTKTELSFIENNHLFKVSFYEDFTTLEFDRDDILSLEELPKDVRIIEKLDGSLDKSLKNKEKVLKKEKSMLI